MTSHDNSIFRVSLQGLGLLAFVFLAQHSSAVAETPSPKIPWKGVECPGQYPIHLQGVCADPDGNIYWSFTDQLVKTDGRGQLLKAVSVPAHHGDLCYFDEKIYVAVNLGAFNQPAGQADSWVYVYDAATLDKLSKHEVQDVVHGAGGIEHRGQSFFVVGGLPEGVPENYIYEYTHDWKLKQRHVLKSGTTLKGIQTVLFHDNAWWFGCYGDPKILLKADADFNIVGRWPFDASYGLIGVAPGKFLVARDPRRKGQKRRAALIPAVADEKAGMKVRK